MNKGIDWNKKDMYEGIGRPDLKPKYKENITQEERILRLLKERGEVGVKVWELTNSRNVGGLGIAQYGARILGLRRKGHKIKNKEPGHFVLVETPSDTRRTAHSQQATESLKTDGRHSQVEFTF